jgi:predicted phosphodiesterase
VLAVLKEVRRRARHLAGALVLCALAGCSAPLQQAATTVAASQRVAAVTPAPTSTLPNARGSVKFLVIGDSGSGDRFQYEVGARIAAARELFPFTFALMLGDNIYGSNNAAAYRNKFERPYAPLLSAGVKFYAVLGNHDDGSQRFYTAFNMDEKQFYTHEHDGVKFFAVNSTYRSPDQLRWLQTELTRSNEKWKIAYMHHPLYSSGKKHGSEADMRAAMEPLFLEHGVDVVFAGHEHFYERLTPQKGIVYVTQGAAAKLRRGNIRKNSPMTAKGFDTDRSFTLVEIVGDHMYLETISRIGQIVDSTIITRREVNETAASD